LNNALEQRTKESPHLLMPRAQELIRELVSLDVRRVGRHEGIEIVLVVRFDLLLYDPLSILNLGGPLLILRSILRGAGGRDQHRGRNRDPGGPAHARKFPTHRQFFEPNRDVTSPLDRLDVQHRILLPHISIFP
jgi:hypothetical protein